MKGKKIMSDLLRNKVYDAVRVALSEAGGDLSMLDRAGIVKRFVAEGGTRTTVFRWIAATVDRVDVDFSKGKLPPIPKITLIWPTPQPVFNDPAAFKLATVQTTRLTTHEVDQSSGACQNAVFDAKIARNIRAIKPPAVYAQANFGEAGAYVVYQDMVSLFLHGSTAIRRYVL